MRLRFGSLLGYHLYLPHSHEIDDFGITLRILRLKSGFDETFVQKQMAAVHQRLTVLTNHIPLKITNLDKEQFQLIFR